MHKKCSMKSTGLATLHWNSRSFCNDFTFSLDLWPFPGDHDPWLTSPTPGCVQELERRVQAQGPDFHPEVKAFALLRRQVQRFCDDLDLHPRGLDPTSPREGKSTPRLVEAFVKERRSDLDTTLEVKAGDWSRSFMVRGRDCVLMTLPETRLVDIARYWQYGPPLGALG